VRRPTASVPAHAESASQLTCELRVVEVAELERLGDHRLRDLGRDSARGELRLDLGHGLRSDRERVGNEPQRLLVMSLLDVL
jgi:hypothetical protein